MRPCQTSLLMPESLAVHMQVLQAKVAALEMEENAKVPSVLSDPMKVPDVCVPQPGMPVAAVMPTHKPSSAAVALKTSLDVPSAGPAASGSLSSGVASLWRSVYRCDSDEIGSCPSIPGTKLSGFCACMQRSAALTPRAQRSSSVAGSDLDPTVFPLSVRVPGQSANSPDLSFSDSAGGIPTPQHIHSAASEAQALAQEAAQLKVQAQSYQASGSADP